MPIELEGKVITKPLENTCENEFTISLFTITIKSFCERYVLRHFSVSRDILLRSLLFLSCEISSSLIYSLLINKIVRIQKPSVICLIIKYHNPGINCCHWKSQSYFNNLSLYRLMNNSTRET